MQDDPVVVASGRLGSEPIPWGTSGLRSIHGRALLLLRAEDEARSAGLAALRDPTGGEGQENLVWGDRPADDTLTA